MNSSTFIFPHISQQPNIHWKPNASPHHSKNKILKPQIEHKSNTTPTPTQQNNNNPTVVDGPIRGRSNAAKDADISKPKHWNSYIHNPQNAEHFKPTKSSIDGRTHPKHVNVVAPVKGPPDLKAAASGKR